ncbi:MAG: FAD-dependent oxidoreductase [bacterium]
METENIFELAILGGGPAGVAAGVYAARKKINTIFITKHFHGQSSVSDNIQNWIGEVSINGLELAKKMEAHIKAVAGDTVKIVENEDVTSIKKEGELFLIQTSTVLHKAKTILVTTGSHRRKLDILGADKFEHKGLTYCATCDAPMFGGMEVTVIGGGNSAFEAASQLSSYASKVTILHRSAEFRADPITVQKVLTNEKITAVKNAELLEVVGEKFVTGIKYKDKISGAESLLPVSGIFVEIGHLPNTSLVEGVVELDTHKQIIVDPITQKTKTEGAWAAGDCTNGLYKQNNIAVGDAVKALEDIYIYLKTK